LLCPLHHRLQGCAPQAKKILKGQQYDRGPAVTPLHHHTVASLLACSHRSTRQPARRRRRKFHAPESERILSPPQALHVGQPQAKKKFSPPSRSLKLLEDQRFWNAVAGEKKIKEKILQKKRPGVLLLGPCSLVLVDIR